MSEAIRIPNDLSRLSGRQYFVLTHYYGLGGHQRFSPKEIGLRLNQALAESRTTVKGRESTLARGSVSPSGVRKQLYSALETLTGIYPAFRLDHFEPPVGPITPAQFEPSEWTLNYEERWELHKLKRERKIRQNIENALAAIKEWEAELEKLKSSPTL